MLFGVIFGTGMSGSQTLGYISLLVCAHAQSTLGQWKNDGQGSCLVNYHDSKRDVWSDTSTLEKRQLPKNTWDEVR